MAVTGEAFPVTSFPKATPMLFKLSYENPSDRSVTRVLAWSLMACHKLDQASKEYSRLLSADNPSPDDYLNAGYCRWMRGDINGAIDMFGLYLSKGDGVLSEEFEKDRDILISGGISPFEINMMVDMCS